MMTKKNTKIFIDTNVFLGLYNSNDAGDVRSFMQSLFKNKNVLISTEQAYNEYLRNRTRIIGEFKNSFVSSKVKSQTSSFVRSFTEYADYLKCFKDLEKQQKIILSKIDEILSDSSQDYIYENFIKLWKANNIIPTKDEFINLAIKRKTLGNPPGGDKYSSGDEVIWETLVNTIECNLIIVSKDHTYMLNKEFLKREFCKDSDRELIICDTVHAAFSLLNIEMDEKAIRAEDTVRWLDIIIQALKQLGGRGTLAEIYEECTDLVSLFYTGKKENEAIDSTVRRTIYQHSSDVTAFLGKYDIFHRVEPGVWELREDKSMK